MRGLGVKILCVHLCAARAAVAEPCADPSVAAADCKHPHTFVLKKKPELADPVAEQEKLRRMASEGAEPSGTSFDPAFSDAPPSEHYTRPDAGKVSGGESPESAHLFTFSKTPRQPRVLPEPGVRYARCDSTIAAGADEPESIKMYVGGRHGLAKIFWDTFSVKDRIQVFHEKQLLVDSGCVGEKRTRDFPVPKNAKWLRIEITPNCDGTIGTFWEFTLTCPPPNEPITPAFLDFSSPRTAPLYATLEAEKWGESCTGAQGRSRP